MQLLHLSLIIVVRSWSLDTPRRYVVTDTDGTLAAVVTRDKSSTLRAPLNCPSWLSSHPCTCSVDLVVRCQGQKVTEVPRFPPEVYHIVFAELNMAGANVHKLHPDEFLTLRVRRVVLTGNRIGEDLSNYVFSSLGIHLTSLMLGACAIRTLPPRLLVDLAQLKVLHLWSNQIDYIPNDFFISNAALHELSLWGNRLQTIQNRTFRGLHRLRVLDLDRNRISTLERQVLGHVSGTLQVLRLSGNHISAISDSAFIDLRQLRILTLDSNRVRFVDARTFVGLRQLQSLCLANNFIQFLADGAFRDLVQLRTLDLSGNKLERVWAGTFIGLNSLTSVDLSRNRLLRLPEATFGQSQALRRLVWHLLRLPISSDFRFSHFRFQRLPAGVRHCGSWSGISRLPVSSDFRFSNFRFGDFRFQRLSASLRHCGGWSGTSSDFRFPSTSGSVTSGFRDFRRVSSIAAVGLGSPDFRFPLTSGSATSGSATSGFSDFRPVPGAAAVSLGR